MRAARRASRCAASPPALRLRLGSVVALLLAAGVLAPPAAAQNQPGLDCNLFGPDVPCDPYLLYPLGQDLRLVVRTREAARARRANSRISTLRELFAELRACWQPPPLDQGRAGMEITIRLSFKRDGTINGVPRFTYMTRAASDEQRKAYREAVLASIRECTPLPFGNGLGGAVAGRPLVIRYIDNRNSKSAGMEDHHGR